MRSWAIISAGLAVATPVVAWTVAQRLQPAGYSANRQTISALAAHGATDRWVMTVGLVVLGLCHIVTASGIPEVGRPARLVLALAGVSTIVVAARPQPDAGHLQAAAVGFIALAVWSLPARVIGRPVRLVASLLIAGVAVWFATQLNGGALLGLSERVLVIAEALWPLLVVGTLLARHRHRHRRTAGAADRA